MQIPKSSKSSFLFHNFKGRAPRLFCAAVFAVSLSITPSGSAQSSPPLTTIDFENLSGPSMFSNVSPPLTISSATLSGGQVLTNATFLPADPTSVYGTANFCAGCSPQITIDFAQKVSNFSMLLLNGETFTVTYTVEDDQGGSTQITLVANSQGEQRLSSFLTLTFAKSS